MTLASVDWLSDRTPDWSNKEHVFCLDLQPKRSGISLQFEKKSPLSSHKKHLGWDQWTRVCAVCLWVPYIVGVVSAISHVLQGEPLGPLLSLQEHARASIR